MPVEYVDIPTGVNDGAEKKIFQELYEDPAGQPGHGSAVHNGGSSRDCC